jgi:hypothetical protein
MPRDYPTTATLDDAIIGFGQVAELWAILRRHPLGPEVAQLTHVFCEPLRIGFSWQFPCSAHLSAD